MKSLIIAIVGAAIVGSSFGQQQQQQQQPQQQQPQQQLRGSRDLGLFEDDNAPHEIHDRLPAVHHRQHVSSSGSGSGSDGGGTALIPAAAASTTNTAAQRRPLCQSIIAIGNTRLPPSSSLSNRQTMDSQEQEGVEEEEGRGLDEEFVCELSSGQTIPIHSTMDQLSELRLALNNGTLISSVSTIGVVEEVMAPPPQAGAQGGGSETTDYEMIAGMKPPSLEAGGDAATTSDSTSTTATVSFDSVTLPPGTIHLNNNNNNNQRRLNNNNKRSLASYTGTKSALIVLVTDINGLSVPEDAQTVSDKFFGTHGDTATMKSQFASCSYNTMTILNNGSYGVNNRHIVSKLSAPGVLEVTIDISLIGNPQHLIRGSVQRAVEAKLGTAGLPYGLSNSREAFDHVFYVLEKCYMDCGWAAYAYVNSWLSVYQSRYFKYVGVQMHELGHNLNLAHSGGLNGMTYTDHTCLMGNPLFSDHVGGMCFNPAKNYQIVMEQSGNPGKGNWYNQDRVQTWDSSSSNDGKKWNGRLVGIAEYGELPKNSNSNNPNDPHSKSRVVLKLETGFYVDLYVGFNRNVGFNSDNVQASNLVTVTETGANGVGYSQSFLKATLNKGQKYSVPNWRNTGEELVVTVNEIRTDVIPGYADVTVQLGDDDTAATPSPTQSPTPRPTDYPTSLPTAMPTNFPSRAPTASPTASPTKNPTLAPTEEEKEFELSTRIVSPNRVANGTMFTVHALHSDVSITSLSTFTKSKVSGAIQVYARQGPYSGHTASNQGWTLIYDQYKDQRGLTELTHLGPFINGQRVKIPAGDSVSFYVYTAERLVYQYRNDWSEGNGVLDDGNVKLYAGIAVAYGKWEEGCRPGVSPQPGNKCLFTPRVFSGTVEYSMKGSADNEGSAATGATVTASTGVAASSTTTTTTSASTASAATTTSTSTTTAATTTSTTTTTTAAPPGSIVEFSTPDMKGAASSAKGLMFTIEAKQKNNIVVKGFNIVAKRNGASEILIYYRSGRHVGEPLQPAGWNLVYEGNPLGKSNKLVDLGDFQQEVEIPAGGVVSFYIYNQKSMMYTDGKNEGEVYGDDDAIVIHEGRVTRSHFRKPSGVGKLAGVVRYAVQ